MNNKAKIASNARAASIDARANAIIDSVMAQQRNRNIQREYEFANLQNKRRDIPKEFRLVGNRIDRRMANGSINMSMLGFNGANKAEPNEPIILPSNQELRTLRENTRIPRDFQFASETIGDRVFGSDRN